MMKSPAHICQMPATIHNGEKLMQHQNPKKMATKYQWLDETSLSLKCQFTYPSANASSFAGVLHIPRLITLGAAFAATRGCHVGEEVLHRLKDSNVSKRKQSSLCLVCQISRNDLLLVCVSRKTSTLPDRTKF